MYICDGHRMKRITKATAKKNKINEEKRAEGEKHD